MAGAPLTNRQIGKGLIGIAFLSAVGLLVLDHLRRVRVDRYLWTGKRANNDIGSFGRRPGTTSYGDLFRSSPATRPGHFH